MTDFKKIIAVLGGTFDPVHLGHLHAARSVAEALAAAEVQLMPTAAPPHKAPPLASAADRLAMLELAVAGEARLGVSTLELQRQGPSYTYLTLRQIRQQHGAGCEIAWIVGLDMLADLPMWRCADEVVEQARIIAVARPPAPADYSDLRRRLARRFGPERAETLIGGILAIEPLDISSTEIRRRCVAGRSIEGLTPPAVADYIARRGLYRQD